jgi:hypothetical protein
MDCRKYLVTQTVATVATTRAAPIHHHLRHREAIIRLHRRLHHQAAAPEAVAVEAAVAAAVVQAGLTVNTEL